MSACYRFTLIELLLVCAIIAILSGTLLPALSRTRSLARGIQCRSVMRQLGAAEASYSSLYSDYVVPAQAGKRRWMELLHEELPTLCNRRNKTDGEEKVAVPLCSASSTEDGRAIRVGSITTYTLWQNGSVESNMGGYSRWGTAGGFWNAAGIVVYEPVKTSRVVNPSGKITLFDGYYSVLMLQAQFDNAPERGGTAWDLHGGGGVNAVFADGHVDALRRCRMGDREGEQTVRERYFELTR